MSVDWKECLLQSLKLVPFFAFVALYFSLVRDDTNLILSTFLRCGPTIGLMLFVLTKGIKCDDKFIQSQLILIGLGLSCIGDLLLNLDLLRVAVGFFTATHIFYASVFHTEGYIFWKKVTLSILSSLAVGTYIAIFHLLDLALKIELPFYVFFLSIMAWKGVFCVIEKRTVLALSFAVGTLLFYIDPFLVCVDVYLSSTSIPRVYIMATYYAAQFFIALSTLSETKTVSVDLVTA